MLSIYADGGGKKQIKKKKEYCKFTFRPESNSDESMCSKTCGNFNMKWIFRLSQQEKKKKKLQKGFYMQQIWQHNPTMNYGNIKTQRAELRLQDAKIKAPGSK